MPLLSTEPVDRLSRHRLAQRSMPAPTPRRARRPSLPAVVAAVVVATMAVLVLLGFDRSPDPVPPVAAAVDEALAARSALVARDAGAGAIPVGARAAADELDAAPSLGAGGSTGAVAPSSGGEDGQDGDEPTKAATGTVDPAGGDDDESAGVGPTSTSADGSTTVPQTPDPDSAAGRTADPGPGAPVGTTPGPTADEAGPAAGPSSTRPGSVTTPTSLAPRPTSVSTATPPPTRPTTTAPIGTGTAGELIWEENFDRLDTNRWAPEHSTYGDGNNELQCYRPENVSVSDGMLRLRAVTESYTCPNGSTRSVTSGMVRSRGVGFEPGQALEFRVRLTPGKPADQGGLWPAVSATGWAGGGWPTGGELDYLEVMTAKNPNRSVFSIHYAEPDGGHGVSNRAVVGPEPFSARWHVVRFEYGLGGRLVWFLDGRQVHAIDAADTIQGYPRPFDQRIGEIKINLALGGRPGPLATGAVGSKGALFEVDYIRIRRL